MCIVYMAFENDVDMARISKLLSWNNITIQEPIIEHNNFKWIDVISENLIRRNICCFGKYHDVYHSEENQKDFARLSELFPTWSSEQKSDFIEFNQIYYEEIKRWYQFDAEWWLVCLKALVTEFHTVQVVYTKGEEIKDFTKMDAMEKLITPLDKLKENTLLYLPHLTLLIIKDVL